MLLDVNVLLVKQDFVFTPSRRHYENDTKRTTLTYFDIPVNTEVSVKSTSTYIHTRV